MYIIKTMTQFSICIPTHFSAKRIVYAIQTCKRTKLHSFFFFLFSELQQRNKLHNFILKLMRMVSKEMSGKM